MERIGATQSASQRERRGKELLKTRRRGSTI